MPWVAARAATSPWGRLVLLALFLAVAACAVVVIGPDRLLRPRTGGWSWPLFVAVYALGTLAFVPKPALSAAAGALFGVGHGVLLAAAGTTLGALLGFALGRLLGRDALRPVLRSGMPAALEQRLSDRAFTSVLMLRLLPVMPFAVVNLGAAFSRARWLPFAVATLLGTLPGNAVSVLTGASAATPSSAWLWAPAAAWGALLGAWVLRRVVLRRTGRARAGGAPDEHRTAPAVR
ncbi:TVP38/TMEM64 family protein [Streptomyces sp. URMC 129]|uniref:TVP38/TMEM64 family protein n=1 Tax=Streptomyces sp. URMC 129 TaxID=3423407 RepID=UPI003F196093